MSVRNESKSGVFRLYLAAVILLVGVLLFYLWGHVKTMHQGEEIKRLQAERESLSRQRERLQAQLIGLKRSSRIREIAADQLGMVFPSDPPQNLYLTPPE